MEVIELYALSGCELYKDSVVRKTRKAGGGKSRETLGRREFSHGSSSYADHDGSLVPTAMRVPTSRPSSAGAGPSSGSRWPPAGCACCCTCGRWWRPSAVLLGSSMCEACRWKGRPLSKCPRGLSTDGHFSKSWLPLAFRGGKIT